MKQEADNKKLQEAYDSMTAGFSALQNRIFRLQSDLAVLEYEKKNHTICEQCGRKSRLITEEHAHGKTFQMTYERKDASLSLSCSKLSNNWISVDDRLPEKPDMYLVCGWCQESDVPMMTTAEFVSGCGRVNGWIPDNKWIVCTTVTHWMPLPEPPKEK